MRAKPGKLENLDKYFNNGKDFEFTKEEYEKITGSVVSQNLNYMKKKSALAKVAMKKGYVIEIEPIKVIPMKIYFKKIK